MTEEGIEKRLTRVLSPGFRPLVEYLRNGETRREYARTGIRADATAIADVLPVAGTLNAHLKGTTVPRLANLLYRLLLTERRLCGDEAASHHARPDAPPDSGRFTGKTGTASRTVESIAFFSGIHDDSATAAAEALADLEEMDVLAAWIVRARLAEGFGTELVLDQVGDNYLATPPDDLRLVLLLDACGTTLAHWFANGKTVRALLPVLRKGVSEASPEDDHRG